MIGDKFVPREDRSADSFNVSIPAMIEVVLKSHGTSHIDQVALKKHWQVGGRSLNPYTLQIADTVAIL